MPTLTPTKLTLATSKASDVLYVEPAQVVTDAMLGELMPGAGSLNVPFIADLLSGMLTHERCGTHLYRSVAGRTNNPVLRDKYLAFGRETEHHVEVLESLVTAMGGNPSYVSPTARAVEVMNAKTLESTFLLAGSLDVMTQEMVMLDAVFLAESMDHANWSTLATLVQHLPEGELRAGFERAVADVEDEEDEHLQWARQTKQRLVTMQARSEMLATVGAKAEELVARVRNWLAD